MDLHQILFLLILAGGLYLFVSERLRVDVSAMLVLLALVLCGVLKPDQALSGFSSEPAIVVAAIFVLSADQLPRPARNPPVVSCFACDSLVAFTGIT